MNEKSQPYKEWIGLFDEEVSKSWERENRKELQLAAMIIFALKRELRRLTDILEIDLTNIRQQLLVRDSLENRKKGIMSPDSNDETYLSAVCNKENTLLIKPKTKKESLQANLSNEVESPDIFWDVDHNISSVSSTENNTHIIVSEDDCTKFEDSPTIKKKRRSYYKRKKASVSLNLLKLPAQIEVETPPNIQLKKELFKTPGPRISEDLLECSIIENTPEVKVKKPKNSSKSNIFLSKKKSKSRTKNTLTQMFSGAMEQKKMETTNKSENKIDEEDYDSDQTYFENDNQSKIGITKMLSMINKDNTNFVLSTNDPTTSRTNKSENKIDKEDYDSDQTYFPNDNQSKIGMTKTLSIIKKDNTNVELSTNHTTTSRNYDELDDSTKMEIDAHFDDSQNRAKKLNELIAAANNVLEHQTQPDIVVRGKARQKLPGWACRDCEKFYTRQALSPEELAKKMNECSKHRGKYKPREDTMPGFWDLTI